ncbi:MAG: hypothetical protein LBN29_08585 [Mediterranea sp.]|jgi:metal-responsive CopG/Arc/MetJ family transcriptional regulator|nr:hypothetical protein [Mediterranea sp.]
MKKKPQKPAARPCKRTRRICVQLSDDEQRIVDRHLKRYKITNRSRWIRETILATIYKKMDEDYPTLFDEHEMRR